MSVAEQHLPTNRSFFSRWSKIAENAKSARDDRALFLASAAIAIFYNLLGGLDIISTMAGLQAQLGVEANPIIRLMMEHFANGWIPMKLALQLVVTAMILWFPHRFVLTIFSLSMCAMMYVVWSNFHIAGLM